MELCCISKAALVLGKKARRHNPDARLQVHDLPRLRLPVREVDPTSSRCVVEWQL